MSAAPYIAEEEDTSPVVCVGTCMVCRPECPVHAERRRVAEARRREREAKKPDAPKLP